MVDTACTETLERDLDAERSNSAPCEEGSLGDVSCLSAQRGYFQRKYWIDRIVGSVLLVVFSLPILILASLVKLTSRGPAFYRQERLGLNRKTFKILKLRSMVHDAEKDGNAVWCVKNDARVTPLGRLLRRLHLDELPQLVNVARGEMALVGPRPERPQICEKLAKQIDGYYRRVSVKPGVTGLAQINLPPDEVIDDAVKKQVLDLCYIEQANAWLDIRMLLATALRMIGIKGETVMRLMRVCRRELIHDLEKSLDTDRGSDGAFDTQPTDWVEQESAAPSLAFSVPATTGTAASSPEPTAAPRRPR